jgi:hypothetical protein
VLRVSLYQPEDLADITRVFESRDLGVDPKKFPLPSFSDPLIRSKVVVRSSDGKFVACGFSRACIETGLVMDGTASDEDRRVALFNLHAGILCDSKERGYDKAFAFITPKPAGWSKVMEKLGWQEETRKPYYWSFGDK